MTDASAARREGSRPGTKRGRPRFTIVSAVYDVEPYLREFIDSIEAQELDHDAIEVVVVDDGSTDGSLGVLEAWRDRSTLAITVLHQENAGQAAARNLGLEHATGEWVTFTDPDDILDPKYLLAFDGFAQTWPGVELLTSRVVFYEDARGRRLDKHPRKWQFTKGSRVIDLEREPNAFASSTVSAFRLDLIRRDGIRFDPRIRPAFEDAHFAATYVLALPHPRMGVVRQAKYLYRRRASLTSATQNMWSDPDRFTTMFERGYLDILERARRPDGSIAAWAQHLVIYELTALLREHDSPSSKLRIPPDVHARFIELFVRTASMLDDRTIRQHRIRRMRPEWQALLVHGAPGTPWHSTRATRTRVDRRMGLQRVTYRYVGPRPEESIVEGGVPIEPAWAKHVTERYFDSILVHLRVLWLPVGPVELRLDGEPVTIVDAPPPRRLARFRRRPRRRLGKVRRYLTGRALREWPREHPTAVADALMRVRARLTAIWPYRRAWVLMDRVHDADDNGERLFEYLREHRRDINAWFVLEEGTPDWDRMRRRYGRRVVPYGSEQWRALLLNAEWVLSSHSDRPIMQPSPVLRLTDLVTPWKFAFLQHGVIKDDLSPWMNLYDHDLVVTSTEPEWHSLADDETAYRVTAKEVRLTGLPRFDRLLAKAAAVPERERDLVIVGPTWRSWLALPLEANTQRRDLRDAFWNSDYLRCWLAILRDPRVAEAARAAGVRVAFMPHPNLQHALDELELPAHVEALTFTGADVQALYARLALFVTDYSSVAFNAAYIDRPVVYYQFDRDRVLQGGHVGRPGYFDYERDGFGPVALTHDEAVGAIVAAIEHGRTPAEPYAARIAATFPPRDGRASERVVAAVEELSRPVTR